MRSAAFCLVMVLVMFSAGVADVPQTMSYQGVLKDSTGARVPDGVYDLNFRLYTTSTGGSPVWTELQAVNATDGVIGAALGEIDPLGKNLFGQQLWLGISIDYGPELYPRTQLTTAPYAFRAAVAESLVGGSSGGDSDWLFNGTGDIYRLSGDVGIGVTQPGARLDVVAPSGGFAILATASDSTNSAGRFVAEGNGVGLIANSQGSGSALYSLAQDTGYAGHFVGGNGVRIDGMCDVDAFQMYPNSEAGHVLTSDASGAGTWQAPAALPDADWTISGDDMYALPSGNIGIGTTTPTKKLHVQSGTETAVLLESSSETLLPTLRVKNRVGTAGKFEAGPPMGGYFHGPVALDVAASGSALGGAFMTHGSGQAVTAFSGGTGDAIYARSDSSGYAIRAEVMGTGYSAFFSGGAGVLVYDKLKVEGSAPRAGEFTSDYASDDTRVLHAEVTSTAMYDAVAVSGQSIPVEGYGTGGLFNGGYRGVVGEVFQFTPISRDRAGVRGSATSMGEEGLTSGVEGSAYGGFISAGVYGSSTGGVYSYGVYGTASGGSTLSLAARFGGDVEVVGTLTKSAGSFKIDHPLDPANKYLSHSFVESPDMMNVYNGNVMLDGAGEARVELPEWFEVLNRDFRYQLTCIGGFAPVYVAEEIRGNSFKVAGGEPGMKVSWMVTGVRQDKYAEENRILVEEDKRPDEAGKYLHPELHGMPREEGIGYLDPGTEESGR